MSKKSDTRIGILLQCIEEGVPINRACEFAKIHVDTYYDWYKTDENFRLKADFAKGKSIRELVDLTKKKDPWKILKNADPENFMDEQRNYNINEERKLGELEATKEEIEESLPTWEN